MITSFLHRHPRILLLMIVTIVLAGVSSYVVMPRLEDPVLRKRVAVVSTVFPGTDPQTIESSITIPIEQALKELPEVKQIRSNTRKDISNVVIELRDEIVETGPVWIEVEDRLKSLTTELPEGSQSPSLEVFPLKACAAILSITPETTAQPTDWNSIQRLALQLKDRILSIDGTQKVEVFGETPEEISILVKPEILASTGLSTGRIAAQIQERNSYSGGRLGAAATNLSIDVQSQSALIQRLESSPIKYRADLEPAILSEIAEVRRQITTPRSSYAFVDDRQSIVLGAIVEDAVRVDHWTIELQQQIADFETQFPGNYSIEPLFLQSNHIHERMTDLLKNLGITSAAVIFVVLLMMGWRCMIIVAASLPLSALAVIVGMRMLEIPVHQMSVTGLIVALGLLIDNAIVMVEEVRSRIYSGRSHLAATLDAVRHLRLPLFGSTLTTVLAFLPIASLPGPAGEFVGSIAISVIFAISASFLLSITIIPPLVSLLGVDASQRGFLDFGINAGWLEWIYRGSLQTVFRVPVLGVLLGVALPIFGFYSSQFLPRQFFPATDRSQIQVELELSAANSTESTRKTMQIVRELIATNDWVERQCWFVGGSAPTFYYNVIPSRKNVPSYAQAFVDVGDDADITKLVDDLQQMIDGSVYNARVVVSELQQGPPFDAPVEVRIFGSDFEQLKEIGTEVRWHLANQQHVISTRSDLQDSIPQLDFNLNDALARDAQTNREDIGRFLYASTEGAPVGKVFDEGVELPINVRVDYSNRSQVKLLSALPVTFASSTGSANNQRMGTPQFYTVGSLGEFKIDADVAAIVRINGRRVNEVKAYLRPGVLPESILNNFKNDLGESNLQLPDGYELKFGGESEQRNNAVSALMATAVTLLSIMLLSLVAVLGSFRNTLIIAATGGLSVGLGPMALWLTGYPLGFMAIVGTMGLIGIAINDSIVVLAAIGANQKLPGEQQRELADVVGGCTRHILTTTLTTMIGFLPLVIYGGEFWPPLAIVIAAGVGGATLLALYFVPSLHRLVNG